MIKEKREGVRGSDSPHLYLKIWACLFAEDKGLEGSLEKLKIQQAREMSPSMMSWRG